MAKASRRQHFIARFYLRNFAEPMFSDNLWVYDLQKRHWERRSPGGVGWFPHLCSMLDREGNRTDEFDQFLKLKVEDPAAPALKKLALGDAIDSDDRSAIASFIALTAARSLEMMTEVRTNYLKKLGTTERTELDEVVRQWCAWTSKPYDSTAHGEFLKPDSFGGIWYWSQDLQRRLLQWEWHVVETTREKPFVTSDRPVFAQWDRDRDVRMVSFPVSSEIALVIISGGQFNTVRDPANEATVMNCQTTQLATEFIVCCERRFPAEEFILKAQ